jgi:hypothetical protein
MLIGSDSVFLCFTRYYAAFPPLHSKFTEPSGSLSTLIPEPASAWSGKKVLADSFGKNKPCNTSLQGAIPSEEKLVDASGWGEENKENRVKNNSMWKEVGRENMKSSNQMREKTKGKKEDGYGFAWSMAGEQSEGFTNFCPRGVSENNSSSELLRVSHYNRQNKGSKTYDSSPEVEMQAHQENGWENAVCRRLYERHTHEGNCVFLGSVDYKKEEVKKKCSAVDAYGTVHCKSLEQCTEDQNLAQLIAKFDHSIEALWNPDDGSSALDKFCSEELVDCDQELPMNFQQLLSSPDEHYLAVELFNLNGKRNQSVFSTSNSFIQCGTNITSSIWSDQPSQENSIEQDDFAMDYMQCEQQNMSSHVEDSKGKFADACCNGSEIKGNSYAVLVVGEGKIVGNKLHSGEQLKGITYVEKNQSGSSCKESHVLEIGRCCAVPASEEKSELSWNKYDTFSSLFTSLPWAANYTVSDITQGIGTARWSSVEATSTHDSYSPFGNISTSICGHINKSTESNFNNTCTNVRNDSLITLNHNKEDSSFTEVIPKQSSLSGLLADTFDSGAVQQQKKSVSVEYVCHLESVDCGSSKGGNLEEREEEDLLTSTRTHFRPIRMENMDSDHSTNTGNNNNVGCYADGTTFVIPTSLEEVIFKRSESGTLYLEADADAGLEAPKYMEYKEKEPYGGRHRCKEQLQNGDDNSREFIPKFRVRQNEKWCQTEEADDMLQSDEEVDTKRSRQEFKAINDHEDFYFPDDDHFAEKVINSLEESYEDKTEIENRNSSACHPRTDTHKNTIFNSVGSETLNGVVPKVPNNSSCKCSSSSNHLHIWKTGWPESSQVPELSVWESTGSDKPQSW